MSEIEEADLMREASQRGSLSCDSTEISREALSMCIEASILCPDVSFYCLLVRNGETYLSLLLVYISSGREVTVSRESL